MGVNVKLHTTAFEMYVDCEFFNAVRGIHVCKVYKNVRTRRACDLIVWVPGSLLLALSVPSV
jgi:hypothetical protein